MGASSIGAFGAYAGVSALSSGVTIDSAQSFMGNQSMWQGESGGTMGVYYNVYSSYFVGVFGEFGGATSGKFVGVSFDISGATHYGWLRFDTNATNDEWTLVDMSYNKTAGDEVNTGVTVSVDEVSEINVGVNTLNNAINITTDALNSKVDVINMQGQVVASEVITSNTTSIANTFASGVYIINIVDANGNAVSKKITL